MVVWCYGKKGVIEYFKMVCGLISCWFDKGVWKKVGGLMMVVCLCWESLGGNIWRGKRMEWCEVGF